MKNTTTTRALHGQTRVSKTLGPAQHGAIKLARRYGDALVCVRYRQDLDNLMRYTTVELVVAAAPTQHAMAPEGRMRNATLTLTDAELTPRGDARSRAVAMALGARWDPKTRLWHIPARHANLLVPPPPDPPTRSRISPKKK